MSSRMSGRFQLTSGMRNGSTTAFLAAQLFLVSAVVVAPWTYQRLAEPRPTLPRLLPVTPP